MQKLLVAAFAAVVGVGAAQAADLGQRPTSLKDEIAYAPVPIWTGYYVGGHLGGLWNDGTSVGSGERRCHKVEEEGEGASVTKKCGDWKEFKNASFDHADDNVTLVGGVHVGHNWQFGSRVVGIEGDVSFADGFDYLASLRGRLGYAEGNLLVFLTGGIAFAGFNGQDVTVTQNADDHKRSRKEDKPVVLSGDDENRVGFVVGGGAEYKLRSNLSVGVEGLYYAFGDSTKTWDWTKGQHCHWKEYQVTEKDDNDLFVVRARLTYHLQDERATPLK